MPSPYTYPSEFLYAPPFYDVKAFGAKGDGVKDDTFAIQQALNAASITGGIAFSQEGNYLLSSSLIIYSNTTLLSTPSTTYTLAANSNCNMIQNVSVTPRRAVTDAAIANSSTSLSSNTANFTSADVGRTVGVAGAATGSKVLIANILSVQSATACTLSLASGVTVNNATCSIYNRDTYIEVAGGYWNRGNNGYVGNINLPGYFTTQFKHIDNIYVHDMTLACTQRGYHVALGDVTNYTVKNITSVTPNNVVNTDVVNVHGPATLGLIDNIHGTNGDDFVSIHSVDGDQNLQDTVGNITDLVVSNLFPYQCGQSAFKAHGGNGTYVTSLTVRGVHGSVNANAIALRDYATPTSDNTIADVLVEDVDCATNGSGLVTIYCNNPVGTITIKNIVWRQANAGIPIIYVLAGNTLRNLIVDGLQIEAGSAVYGILVAGTVTNIDLSNVTCPDTTVQINALIQVQSGVTGVNKISVRNVHWFVSTGAQNPVVLNKGSVKAFILDNIYMNNAGVVFVSKTAAASCQVLMSNIILDGAYQLAQLNACAADFTISNLDAISISQSALIGLIAAGSNMSVRGRGFINPNNYTTFTRDGTQTIRVNHTEMLADLSQLTPGDQDMVNNNNGALSSGAGLCIFHTGGTGNGWKNIYSGSTY